MDTDMMMIQYMMGHITQLTCILYHFFPNDIFENLNMILKNKHLTGWVTVILSNVTMDTPLIFDFFSLKVCFLNPGCTACEGFM